jgi:probable HAF family extracellular repeat protein
MRLMSKFWAIRMVIPIFTFVGTVDATPSFRGLGLLNAGANSYSMAAGVSANGSVVVGTSNNLPVIWTANGIENLGILPSSGTPVYTSAYDVSADGSVVVGTSLSSNQAQAFRWTASSGITALGGVATGNDSQAYGISSDGSVVVGYAEISQETEAVAWTESAGMLDIGGFSSANPSSIAEGVSADGKVVVGVGYATSNTLAGFRWTAASGIQNLNSNAAPGGIVTRGAYAASEDGTVIVGEGGLANGTTEAFRLTATGISGLGTLPGFSSSSVALGVSADGSTIVGYASSAANSVAFVWNPVNGMQNLQQLLSETDGLNLTGWTLIDASDVSPDGQTIVGEGIDPSGFQEAWIATLPEPNGASIGGLAILLLPALVRLQSRSKHPAPAIDRI